MLRKEGYAAYRAKFKEECPQYFIGDDRTVFRCLDSSLKREEKIAACVAHKRALKEVVITSFINHRSNVRSFLNGCLMSVSTEEVLTKSIKKIVSKTVLFLYKRVLKAYRRAYGLKYDPDSGGLSAIHT